MFHQFDRSMNEGAEKLSALVLQDPKLLSGCDALRNLPNSRVHNDVVPLPQDQQQKQLRSGLTKTAVRS